MTRTLDKEKAGACRMRSKIRVSGAVDRLILAKIKCRGLQRRTAGTDATVKPRISLSAPEIYANDHLVGVFRHSFFLGRSLERSTESHICASRSQRSNGEASTMDLCPTNKARFRQKPV